MELDHFPPSSRLFTVYNVQQYLPRFRFSDFLCVFATQCFQSFLKVCFAGVGIPKCGAFLIYPMKKFTQNANSICSKINS